jgi:hypothetical protein
MHLVCISLVGRDLALARQAQTAFYVHSRAQSGSAGQRDGNGDRRYARRGDTWVCDCMGGREGLDGRQGGAFCMSIDRVSISRPEWRNDMIEGAQADVLRSPGPSLRLATHINSPTRGQQRWTPWPTTQRYMWTPRHRSCSSKVPSAAASPP